MEAFLLLLLFILLYVYFSRTARLSRRVEDLDKALREQSETLRRASVELELELRKLKGLSVEAPTSPENLPPAEEREPVVSPPAGPSATLDEVVPVGDQGYVEPRPTLPAVILEPQLAAGEESVHAAAPAGPMPRPQRTRAEWEALIGGKLLNRIGALALIIGVGFFLKYAFDNDWFPEWTRVVLGFLAGTVLLFGGNRFHEKGFEIFSQGLVGSGIAVLYLSAYASFNFYQLVSQPVAFGMMGAITVVTFLQAFRYDSLAVSVLGWVGGFLTPFLLSTGTANEIGLFTYILLLDVGLVAVLVKKDSWVILEPLSLLATYMVYLAWDIASYTPQKLTVVLVFLTLFWGAFTLLDVIRSLRGINTFSRVRHGVAVANAIFYVGIVHKRVDAVYPEWTALLILAIGAVYFGTALAITRRGKDESRTIPRYVLTAIVLLIVATAVQFSGLTTATFWSVEGLFLVWSGIRLKQEYVWWAGLGLLAVTTATLVAVDGALRYAPLEEFQVGLNRRALAFVAGATSLAMTASLFGQVAHSRRAVIRSMLQYGCGLLILTLLMVEVSDAFARLRLGVEDDERIRLAYAGSLSLSMTWLVASLAFVWTSCRTRIIPYLHCSLAGLVLALGLGALQGSTYIPIERFTPVLNVRAGLLVSLAIGLIIHMHWLKRYWGADAWVADVIGALQLVAIMVGFEFISAETRDFFSRQIHLLSPGSPAMSEAGLAFTRAMMLSIAWMAYGLAIVWVGLRRNARLILYAGLGACALGIILAAGRGLRYAPLEAFTPFINSRSVGLGFTIVGIAILLRWLKTARPAGAWVDHLLRLAPILIAVLVFELITVETRDTFDRSVVILTQSTVGTDAGQQIVRLRNLQQLALSGVWLVYSFLLMVAGFWRRVVGLRIVAMVLFGFTIVKIFFYDLSFLQTLYRIFSFIGLGLILLAVSYLYQRYKGVILGGPPTAAESDHRG